MSALGTRPKSIAVVNAVFGYALAAVLQGSLSQVSFDSTSLTSVSLLGSLLAAFLVVVTPVDFLLKRYLAWKLSKGQNRSASFEELVGTFGQANDKRNRTGIAIGLYSDSFMGYERSSMISAFYAIVIFSIISLDTWFSGISELTSLPTPAKVGVVISLALIIIKFERMVSYAPNKLYWIAAYSIGIRRGYLASEVAQNFRRALVEGNWFEAENLRVSVEATLQSQARAQAPTIEAHLRLVAAAIGSLSVLADLSNTGRSRAKSLKMAASYTDLDRTIKTQNLVELRPDQTETLVLDTYVPNQLLEQAKEIRLTVEYTDEGNAAQPPLALNFAIENLFSDFARRTAVGQNRR